MYGYFIVYYISDTNTVLYSGLCEQDRKHSHDRIGEFIPQCDGNGNFLPQQCSGSTGYCWCVNIITGKEIPNTRTPPGVTPVQCGLCEQERKDSHDRIGEFVPQCDVNGNFLPQQCSGSTGYCWCVNIITGEEIPNTRTPPGVTPVQCGLCQEQRKNSPRVPGHFVPKCDANGNFLPQQCSGSTGYCWCVNVITGVEIPNTRTPPGVTRVQCDENSCPEDWSRLGNRCFAFIDSPKTWSEAEDYCLFEGGNLASVHSNEENNFIQILTKEDTHEFPLTWIGGNDCIQSGFWMWTDGTKFNYKNWSKRYNVQDKRRTMHCLEMNYGYRKKWNAASCNDTLPFVCAKEI
ncbi:neurocan core protein [Sander lucioperca]|uniref:neurocan core protein n=1 Tax=Sander lucioperca TaxID=283035 RepID=UPI001653E24B|nr:neurocan core protein [Sander lucioperca]